MKNNTRTIGMQFESLGTEICVQIVIDDESHAVNVEKKLQDIKILYDEFVNVFSRFNEESELSKLNKKIGKFNLASERMLEIVASSLVYNKKTDGLYDPRILAELENVGYADDFKAGVRKSKKKLTNPEQNIFNHELSEDLKIVPRTSLGQKNNAVFFRTRMDFSGIAKGYITDEIVKFLDESGEKNFLVDSGGDMFMRGFNADGERWIIDFEGVKSEKLRLSLSDKGIATSGISRRKWEIDGQRFHHIINPKKTQQFLFNIKSVSVISDSTIDADVWAKTIFLMGKNDGMQYACAHDMAVILIDYRGDVWISPMTKEYIY